MDDLLKGIQRVEYDMLREMDRVCRLNGIRYFLGQGTLLGAAKYGGFIPWDDDIDVLVPFRDLERLMEVFPKEGNRDYIITDSSVERHYPLTWTKIRALHTLSRPKKYASIPLNWGICIDLFPIYPLSDAPLLRKLEIFMFRAANKLMLAEMTRFDGRRSVFVRALELVPRSFRHFFHRFVKAHGENTRYVLLPCKGIKIVERRVIFGEEKRLRFEDGLYPVPTDYHTYLTLNFGDYMAPLPKDQQKGHELSIGDIEWKLKI